MKTLLALILVSIIPPMAVAGPEDHMYETCYTATTITPNEIPSTFCFDYMQLDSDKKFLYTSGFASNLPQSLKVESFIYQTEDRVRFSATEKIVNVWESGCGEGFTATLKINGVSDITQGEQINAKELSINVDLYQTNDTCHSMPYETTIVYKLSKKLTK